MEYIIKCRTRGTWYLSEWLEDDTADLALDFIGPLFARDEFGKFAEVNKAFSSYVNSKEKELKDHVDFILNGILKKETIRIFQQRDPLGRYFYRVIRYLLSKHDSWRKIRIVGIGQVITIDKNNLADQSTLESLASECSYSWGLTTKELEPYFEYVLVKNNYAIPLNLLVGIIRNRHNSVLSEPTDYTVDYPQDLAISVEYWIEDILIILDEIICRYQVKNKISSKEGDAFRSALRQILTDISDGGLTQSYHKYLIQAMDGQLNEIDYKNIYRIRFEYLAKTAKEHFSARVQKVINN